MQLKNLLLSAVMLCTAYYCRADNEPANNTSGGAESIVSGVPQNGSIGKSATDPSDYYQFNTANDGQISLSAALSGGTGYFILELYDNDGVTSLSSAANYTGTTVVATANGLAAGTYYVRIYPYSASDTCSYTLTATLSSPPEPNDLTNNDTPATALSMTENAAVTGHIGYRNNGGSIDMDDYYQFTTTSDGNISLSFTNSEPSHYNQIFLYDADGTTQLATAANYGSVSLTAYGLSAGTYYARINYYTFGYYGGYTLTNTVAATAYANDNELNDSPATALPMAANSSANGHIGFRNNGGTYDMDDYYQIVTSNDGDINLSFTNTDGGHYNQIYLYDADGVTQLGYGAGYGSGSFTASGLAAGTYYARINYYSATYFASYSLTNTLFTDGVTNDSEPNDSPVTALTIPENSSVNGHIGYRLNGGDYDMDDYYSLHTTSDGDITLSFTNVEPGHYNQIYLYDNDGVTQLGYAAGYSAGSLTGYGLEAGDYIVRINYYAAVYFSGYTLSNSVTPATHMVDSELNDNTAAALTMETNSTMEGHIGYRRMGGSYDADDYYTFTTHSAGTVSITLGSDAGKYNTVQLISGDGITVLNTVSGYGGGSFSHPSLSAGTYFVHINYYSASYFSGYTLTNAFCPDAITIIADGETTFCAGESVLLLTEDHHLNYLWSDASTTETDAVTLTGAYNLTIDDGAGCVRTSNSISTESTPLPVAIIEADGPLAFCAGGSVTLSVPGIADTYTWSNGETTPTISVSITGDYSVELTKNSCSAISDPVHITVYPTPLATITADGPTTFCDGGSVTLTSTVAEAYLWSNGETTASILADAGGDFSVMITDDNGCSATSPTTTVTENALPVAGISADGPTTFCTGESVNLTGSGGTSYVWSTGATTTSINVTSSGDYHVTVYNAEGCSAISSDISVSATACGSVSISADGPVEFCEGGSVVLTSSELTGNVWNTGETTQSITVTSSGDYYCVNGVNTSNIISVTVNSNPAPVISAAGPLTFCSGSVGLMVEGAYDSYNWNSGETTPSIITSTSGDYFITVTENGCSGISNTLTVNAEVTPTISIAASGALICYEGSVELTATTDGSTYQWQLAGADIAGATNANYTATVNGKYTCVTTNGICSATSDNIKLKYADRVPITPSGTAHLCGPSMLISVPTTPGATYTWYKNNVVIAGATSHTYTTTVVGKFYVLVSKDGCTRATNVLLVDNVCRLDADTPIELSLAPNPASDAVVISYNIGVAGNTSIALCDLNGRTILTEMKNFSSGNYSETLYTNDLPSGIYVIRITQSNGKTDQQKLVIEK